MQAKLKIDFQCATLAMGSPAKPPERLRPTVFFRTLLTCMEIFLAKTALVFIVALIVGGATYVVLTIIEIVQQK